MAHTDDLELEGETGPEKRNRILAENTDPQSNLQHGTMMRQGVALRCLQCAVRDDCPLSEEGGECGLERAYTEQRRADLATLEWLDVDGLDGPAVASLLWTECRIARAQRWLAKVGELLPGAETGYLEPQPLVGTLDKLLALHLKQIAALGVGPKQRRELRDSGEAAGQSLLEVVQEASQADPVDGQFTATDADPD